MSTDIEKVKQLIQKSHLFDDEKKVLWIKQVLPNANPEQLKKIEQLLEKEQNTYKEETQRLKKQAILLKTAIGKAKKQRQQENEAQKKSEEASVLMSLEEELKNL